MKRIPLDIVVTETGATTGGVIVAVMASELDSQDALVDALSRRIVVTRTTLTNIKNETKDAIARETAHKALEA